MELLHVQIAHRFVLYFVWLLLNSCLSLHVGLAFMCYVLVTMHHDRRYHLEVNCLLVFGVILLIFIQSFPFCVSFVLWFIFYLTRIMLCMFISSCWFSQCGIMFHIVTGVFILLRVVYLFSRLYWLYFINSFLHTSTFTNWKLIFLIAVIVNS